MKAQRVIVTGASGFLGGHLVRDLASLGYSVCALGGHRRIHDDVSAVATQSASFDLKDGEKFHAVVREFAPDLIVHCAAMARGADCERSPEDAFFVNRELPARIARLTAMTGAHLFSVSTDLVFDGGTAPTGGFTETSVPCPVSVYGKSKFAGEERLLAEDPKSWILRTSLIYGPRVGNEEGFLVWLRRGLLEGRAVTLFTDEFRTPILVSDVSEVVHRLYQKVQAKAGSSGGVLHVAGPERISRLEFGRRLARIYGVSEDLLVEASRLEAPSPVPRPEDVSLSIVKLRSELGYEPARPTELAGLRKLGTNSE